MAFSDKIKAVRKKMLLTQTEFASVVGVTYTTINRWESGRGRPGYKGIRKVVDSCRRNGIEFRLDENDF